MSFIYMLLHADWADIFDTPIKQEKTYLKPRFIPFPGNMSFNPESVANRCELERSPCLKPEKH